MKKLLFILSILFTFSVCAFAADQQEFTQNPNARYRLFKTNNFWNFLELDTANGKINMVQFSTNDDTSSGKYVLNPYSVLEKGEKEIPGRFTLYSTQNMYTFIMLDTINGDTYQVQWAMEEKYRFVQRIE